MSKRQVQLICHAIAAAAMTASVLCASAGALWAAYAAAACAVMFLNAAVWISY